uniref:FA complementation group D2 n=1 Tax=Phasianus colchicus TaxID=9054 RepID=A0A669QNT4_PHACC
MVLLTSSKAFESVCGSDSAVFHFCHFSVGTFGTNFPRLILNQFKWLDSLDSQDLVKKLMQMLSVSPVPIQHDIITSLPEILEDSQQNEVARELSCLLKQGRRLTVPILDALSRLDLDAELLAEVRQSAMTIVPSVKLEDLPVVVKFILHNVKAADAVEVRSCLVPFTTIFTMAESSFLVINSSSMSQMTTSQNCVKVLFDVIKLAVRFQKDVSEAWIKVRCTCQTLLEKAILVCLICSCCPFLLDRTAWKKSTDLDKVFEMSCSMLYYISIFQVIKDFFPSILSLAQTFLHSAHPAVVSFGSCMYKQAFAVFDSYCQQEVVCALVTHVCSGNETELDISLDVLTDLVILHTSLLMRYATFVKTILDSMQKLNPCQIRKLFYILSTLAFSQRQEGSYIQDDMHMVIRKWLSSSVPNHKQMGIIGSVTMMGSVALKRTECVNTVVLSTELVFFSCSSFLFPVKSLYNLDEDETQGAIAINLLPLVSQSELGRVTDEMISPICLSPCFRLLRLYTGEQNNGSLEEIDALLGCPLYLTDLEVEGKLDSLSKQEREFLCSLLFYALNWFREVVNAFCQQQDAEMKGKVLTRLQNITELQNVLGKCLAGECEIFVCSGPQLSHVMYCLPFHGDDDGVLPLDVYLPLFSHSGTELNKCLCFGKKKKSDSSKACSAERTQADESSDGNQPDTEETGSPLAQLQSYRPYFRELDLEVFSVLHCGLLTKSVLDTEMHTEASEVVQLGPAELCFLLDDMCCKLEHVLTSGSTRRVPFLKEKGNKDTGFSHLCQRSPKEVAVCVVKLLKPLCNHMENMHNYFQVSGHISPPTLVLSWTFSTLRNGFSQHENSNLLRSALQVLADRLKPGETEFLPLEELISESFQYLLNFQQSVPSFQCAFILAQLLMAISEKPMTGWKREKMASLAKQFLCQSWMKPGGDREKGSQFNSALHTLLCVYLEHTDNILKAIEEISSVGIPELINSAKDGCSSTYPTLSRQTFPVFFRVMMAQLESSVKSIPAGKPSDSSEVQLEKLLKWNIAVRNFHILINLVKVRVNGDDICDIFLVLPCDYGRLFVEAFLKLAMPLLDHSFKKHRDDVQSLLKTLQLSTRQLHHMCGHSKIHQDLGLTNHVPLLKKSLEQFVYRVKAMLAFNHCQEAFWVGILKNRDLQGEEILSQATAAPEEDSEDSADSAAEREPGGSDSDSDSGGAGR